MTMNVIIGLNEETLSALNALTAAIRGIGGQSVQNNTTTTGSSDVEETGPIYWADNSNGHFGKVDAVAEYNKLKKKAPGTYKITEDMHATKVEELKEKNAAAKKAEKTSTAKKDTKKSAPADDEPTVEDVIAAFSAYLPKDLDKEERAERAGFVKPLLARFGAAKATELPAEHRALAINLVERKLAGEDVDPETDEFAELEDGLV